MRILLPLLILLCSNAAFSINRSQPWKNIESVFVNSSRTSQIYRLFYKALNSRNFPVVVLSGRTDEDKTFLIEKYTETFRNHIRFDVNLTQTLSPENLNGPVNEEFFNRVLRAQMQVWEMNRLNGKRTAVLMSTERLNNPYARRTQLMIDYLSALYREMKLFNQRYPGTSVRIIFESKLEREDLQRQLRKRGIGHFFVDFTSVCESLLGRRVLAEDEEP